MLDFLHRLAARIMSPLHCLYFGAVAVEGSGFYALFAAFLLVFSFIEAVKDLRP